MAAQKERERQMKTQFLEFGSFKIGTPSKVLFRFGRNHLNRGYDARGVSTLGKFHRRTGQADVQRRRRRQGKSSGTDADERQCELAFVLLAEKAQYSATHFDLRSIRAILYRIPPAERSVLQTNLMYWADSYDALICY